jgi:hypothetical protein
MCPFARYCERRVNMVQLVNFCYTKDRYKQCQLYWKMVREKYWRV